MPSPKQSYFATIVFLALTFFFSDGNAQLKGKLIDTIKVASAPDQKYSIYIPSSYNQASSTSLLMFLDPGGRATFPLRQYAELAEQYNLIFACSYGSKNGPVEPALRSCYAMLEDIGKNYNINDFFAAGFSGGARIATFMAISDKKFSGVIACGAAFPQGQQIPSGRNLAYALIAGNRDMNYRETQLAEYDMRKIHNPVIRFEFNGGHQWPPVGVFKDALVWQLIQMKKLSNDEVVYFDRKLFMDAVGQKDSLHLLKARMIGEQITDESSIYYKVDSLLDLLDKNPKLKQQQRVLETALLKENELRNSFFRKLENVLFTARPDTSFKRDMWLEYEQEINRLI